MKILFIGDIAGRAGRDAFFQHIGPLKQQHAPDITIVNVDNAAHGYGVTAKLAEEFLNGGADVLTGGNHIWDQREMLVHINRFPRLLRAENMPQATTPGKGHCVIETPSGRKVVVLHLLGRLFMDPMDCPFHAADRILAQFRLGALAHAIFIDFHAEATSEKMALAHHVDGRVSAVIGTHTHIPTADCWILPGGTGFQADAGMTGDFDSVIGMKKEMAVPKFVRKLPGDKLAPANGAGTVCATLVTIDDASGKTSAIRSLRMGGALPPIAL